ncbi:MAG: CpsD/CapB family tyrosine-protein kinase [Edaphobacter sp.]|uniref:CpsD/CapB family tyrosine-protein kinase n=1 Tax=Edaphobacter sp. TaxID=1934404 RepID=UPI00239BB1ED|nr:CpsD/CapB family tyrosine-protein kinase [Edaphobacter sp.]MDE1178117.1 CpsD/CapB family tyrosine-protein kinase [Edaphobacter sp.]
MSRIYEALQKAEAERKQDPRPFEAIDPEASAAVADYEPPTGYAQAEFASALTDHTAAPLPIGNTAFDAFTRHEWNPSIDKLPSLLDRGPSVEQFRSLRSRLYELRDVRPIKSILISSGLPQEGKSFVSANLAISLARHRNSKVLLIDGDMRRYTVHEMIGTSPSPGLADYLSGSATIEEIVQRAELDSTQQGAAAANKAGLSNLAFIPGGNGGDRAADLSGSPRFGELLKAMSPIFDWIIVDSSPVLPVSDAVNLARSCDGVMLVARGSVTKYPVAQRAASELRASNVLGFVLNAVHEAPQVGSYYGYNAGKE